MKTILKQVVKIGIVAALLYVAYQQLTESQKRYVREVVRQAPYLIPRYYV